MPCDNDDCLLCRLEAVLRKGLVSADDRIDLLAMIAEIREESSKMEDSAPVPKSPGTTSSLQDFLNR